MTFKHIRFQFTEYAKDPNYQFFNRESGSEFLPGSISIQETTQTKRIKAPYVIYRRNPREFISGLQRLSNGWFYGDIRNDVRSLLLVHWRPKEKVSLIVFTGYYPNPRKDFIRSFIDNWISLEKIEKGRRENRP
jgi:hypothetical protein